MYSLEEVNEEIKKNGNTNLIANSMIDSQIYAVGDSHSIFFYNSLKIKEHWTFKSGLPVTIYKFINSDIDIYNIGTMIGNRHEEYNIIENDYVIFYFGYNDVQKNIYLYAKNRWKEEINYLSHTFLNKIINLKHQYNIKPIISCIYPNPLTTAIGINSCGTYKERQDYTIYMNNILSSLCSNYNIPFLDIYDDITDDGFIKQEYTKDSIHLDYNHIELRKLVEDKIYELL